MEVMPNVMQKELNIVETMRVRYEIVDGPTRTELMHGFINPEATERVAYFKVMKMAWTAPRIVVEDNRWCAMGICNWLEALNEPVVLPILLEDFQTTKDTVYLTGCLLGDIPSNDLKAEQLCDYYQHRVGKGMCWQDGTKLRIKYHHKTVTGLVEPDEAEIMEIMDGKAVVTGFGTDSDYILETYVSADEGICGMTELRLQQICERLEQNIFVPRPAVMRLTETFHSTENRRDLCNKLWGLCEQIEKRHVDDRGYMKDAKDIEKILHYYQSQRVLRRKHEPKDLIEDELFVSLCGEVADAVIANWAQF